MNRTFDMILKRPASEGFLWAAMLTGMALLDGGLGAPLALISHRAETLKARGVDAFAEVVGKDSGTYRGGHYYDVAYRFTPPGVARRVVGSGSVMPDVFATLRPGARMPITYDPRSPDTNAIDYNQEAHRGHPGRDMWTIVGVSAASNLAFAALLASTAPIRRRRRRAGLIIR